jgi:hypothetical protein
MNSFQKETLRQSREAFNLAQNYYKLGLLSCAASSAIGLAAATSLLLGYSNIATLTALTNILPTLTCHQVINSGAKQLEDASDRLRAIGQ